MKNVVEPSDINLFLFVGIPLKRLLSTFSFNLAIVISNVRK